MRRESMPSLTPELGRSQSGSRGRCPRATKSKWRGKTPKHSDRRPNTRLMYKPWLPCNAPNITQAHVINVDTSTRPSLGRCPAAAPAAVRASADCAVHTHAPHESRLHLDGLSVLAFAGKYALRLHCAHTGAPHHWRRGILEAGHSCEHGHGDTSDCCRRRRLPGPYALARRTRPRSLRSTRGDNGLSLVGGAASRRQKGTRATGAVNVCGSVRASFGIRLQYFQSFGAGAGVAVADAASVGAEGMRRSAISSSSGMSSQSPQVSTSSTSPTARMARFRAVA